MAASAGAVIDGCDCRLYQASRHGVRRPKGIEFTPIFVGTHGTKGIRPLFRALQHGDSVGRRDCATHLIGATCGDRFFAEAG